MEAILLVSFSLLGAALGVSAGEQPQTAQPQKSTAALEGNVAKARIAGDQKSHPEVSRAGRITARLRATGQTVASLLNPSGPVWSKNRRWT